MANPEHLAILEKALEAKDISIWNDWRKEFRVSRPDLNTAELDEADLYKANLSWANLDGADLREASVGYTVFASNDLRTVKGLETIVHLGPSEISFSTFYESGGEIPEVFLRGAGVPDELISFVLHQIGSAKAIEFYSAFISYSARDEEFAKRLYADLQARHVRVWFAPEDLKIGERIEDSIDQAIRVYDKMMLVLSANSIDSAWVRREVKHGLEKEGREARTVLFPIRLDDGVFDCTEQWAHDLRKRHIGDFTTWKQHDDYQKAFERLLRDLQSGK